MTAALALIILLGVLPIGPLMLSYLERQYPLPQTLPEKIDGIIVLGGAFDSNLSAKTGLLAANDHIDRMFCFVDLARKYPQAKLVFSGGAGDILNPDAMEADDASAFFKLVRLDNREILYENKSRNTYENAFYSKEMLKPASGENWIVTTSAYHIPRTVGIFKKLDWNIIPYGCDPKTLGTNDVLSRIPNATGNYYMLNLAVKEMIGMAVYKITGKI